ncbi:MAG: pseudouridine synthase family protein, partial [Acidimicrobiales bacterium]
FQKALDLFKGNHDFRSFCTGNEYQTTERVVDAIELIHTAPGSIIIVFKAKGFLRYMIRRIIGACLEVASGKVSLAALEAALSQKNPNQRFMSAPACGLMLYEIRYT